jgi:hypothetical protein
MTMHQILSLIRFNSILDSCAIFDHESIMEYLEKEGYFVIELGRYRITPKGLQALRTLETQGIESYLVKLEGGYADLPFNCYTVGHVYA